MRQFVSLATLMVATLGFLADGRSDDWPQFHFSADRSGFNPSESLLDGSNVSQLGISWRTKLSGAPVAPPVVVNGIVYAGSNDGKVYALQASSGAILWSGSTGASIPFSPAVDSGRVFVGSDDTNVYAFPASCSTPCSPLWVRPTQGRITSAPAVAGGVVYVGAGRGAEGDLWALDAATGAVLWRAELSSSPIGVAVANGVVYAGAGGLYAFPADCQTTPCPPLWIGSNGGSSQPAVADGTVYVDIGHVNNGFNAYPAACSDPCAPLWIGATDSASPFAVPAAALGLVYRTDLNGNLAAYPAACSTYCYPVWTTNLPSGISFAAVANGIVYAGSGDGRLHAFDALNGSSLASVNVGDPVSTPAIVDGTVYVSSFRGALSTDMGSVVALVLNPVDTTPPTLNVPSGLSVVAPDETGAVVFYVVTADDNVDPNPTFSCDPASGQSFPIGMSTVQCTATDTAGNTGSASFAIEVLPPWQVSISLDSKVLLDRKTGLATVRGQVSCNRPSSVSLFGVLEQITGHSVVRGGGSGFASCDESPSSWSAEVYPESGRFKTGFAKVRVSYFGCEYTCAFGEVSQDVRVVPR
jgi:outer membrane protein assembly factor BamB